MTLKTTKAKSQGVAAPPTATQPYNYFATPFSKTYAGNLGTTKRRPNPRMCVHKVHVGGGNLTIGAPESVSFSNVDSLQEFKHELAKQNLHLVAIPANEPQPAAAPEDAAEQAETWDPYAEGRKIIETLQEAEGGWLDRNDAAKRMDLTVQAILTRVKKNQIVAWQDGAGRFRFPQWQFGHVGLLPGLLECLSELGDSDQWAILRFFLGESEQAGARRPLDLLREGNADDALEIARSQSIHA